MYAKDESIYPAYVSKQNQKCQEQVIPLMIPNREGWHYLAVKKLSTLLRGKTSKSNDNFSYMNCLHSLRTKTNLNHIKEYARIKIFVMLSYIPKTLSIRVYPILKYDKTLLFMLILNL